MKLTQNYSIKFLSDGTDTLTFELTDPPLSLDFGSKDPSALKNPVFRPVTNVPAAPPLKDCTLAGTEVTTTFAGPLPEQATISGPGQGPDDTAVYSLSFDLEF